MPQQRPAAQAQTGQAAQLQNLASNPMAQMGMNYAGKVFGDGTGILSSWLPMKKLEFYFDVDNRYVLRKLKVLFLPFFHKDWSRQHRSADDSGEHSRGAPPREDLNSPDLYIPTMAFVTYVLLMALVLAIDSSFQPDVLGIVASKAMVVISLEVIVIKMGLWILDAQNLPLLDFASTCGYIFVTVVFNILFGWLVGRRLLPTSGSYPYYGMVFFTSTSMALFIIKSLKCVIITDQGAYDNMAMNAKQQRRNYFLFMIAVMQYPVAWFLGLAPY